MTKEDAVKLLRACAVLYTNADEDTKNLAAKEFSGSRTISKNDLEELSKFLISESNKLAHESPKTAPTTVINPTSFGRSGISDIITGRNKK